MKYFVSAFVLCWLAGCGLPGEPQVDPRPAAEMAVENAILDNSRTKFPVLPDPGNSGTTAVHPATPDPQARPTAPVENRRVLLFVRRRPVQQCSRRSCWYDYSEAQAAQACEASLGAMRSKGWAAGEGDGQHIKVIDVDEYPDKAATWRIGRTPTWILTIDGREMERREGHLPPDAAARLYHARPPATPAVPAAGRLESMAPPGVDARAEIGRVVGQLLGTIGRGEIAVNDSYSIVIPAGISATLSRTNERLYLEVASPRPLLRLKWAGIRYDAELRGVEATRERLKLLLGGFPDVTLTLTG